MFNQNAVAIILSKSSRVAGRVAGSLFGERVKKSPPPQGSSMEIPRGLGD